MRVLNRSLHYLKLNTSVPNVITRDTPRNSVFKDYYGLWDVPSTHGDFGSENYNKPGGIFVQFRTSRVETALKGTYFDRPNALDDLRHVIGWHKDNYFFETRVSRVDFCFDVLLPSPDLSLLYQHRQGLMFKPKSGKFQCINYFQNDRNGLSYNSGVYLGNMQTRYVNIYLKGTKLEAERKKFPKAYEFYRERYGVSETEFRKVVRVELRIINRDYLERRFNQFFDFNFKKLYEESFADFFNHYIVKGKKGREYRPWRRLRALALSGTLEY